MLTILIIGIIAILFGIIFIFFPKLMERLNEIGNKIIATDDKTFMYRNLSGVLFITLGIILLLLVLFI